MPPASFQIVGTTRTPPARSRLNTSARVLVAELERLRSIRLALSPSVCDVGEAVVIASVLLRK